MAKLTSIRCVFLGYSPLHKGYKCLHHISSRIYISRDVIFEEIAFPFQNGPPIHNEPTQPTSPLPGLPLLITLTLPHQARPNNPPSHIIPSPSSPISPAVPVLSPTAPSQPTSTLTITSHSLTPIAPSHPMVNQIKSQHLQTPNTSMMVPCIIPFTMPFSPRLVPFSL